MRHYNKERIAEIRKWCELNDGLDIGDFAGLLEEALDEIERLKKLVGEEKPDQQNEYSDKFKTVLEKAQENLETIRRTDGLPDQDMWCSHCHKMLSCRFRPSPEAGPYWRCSECGEVIGKVEEE
jgi:hypothetical protein